jgi:sugar (pentulose or hexulose) kinase
VYLGIEFGSTRIKGIVLNDNFEVIASGSYIWQSTLKDGYWTYDLNEVWVGMNAVIDEIAKTINVKEIKSLGVSAMMHGFLPFDKNGKLLTPFRTWKNTNTTVAATELSKQFAFNIPLRWSIAHLYQAYLDKESYVKDIDTFTTLAGYVHLTLTGKNVLGIGDASGVFPIDVKTKHYNQKMIQTFNDLTDMKLEKLLPGIVEVGEDAGFLTAKGAELLGNKLTVGIPLAPPEGDAETGMVSTNALKPKTGNVSAGTSVFSMIVLEKALNKWYPEIDIVQTPTGDAVAMVHANECTSRIDPWIELFGEAIMRVNGEVDRNHLFETLYEVSLEDTPLGEFMKQKLVEAIIDLKPGMDILLNKEHVKVDYLLGHGGYFKSKSAGRKVMSETLGIPIRLLETAGEGGPWGMAVLAAYRYYNKEQKIKFDKFIEKVFKGA